MVLSTADAALEISLLVLQESEARPGLPLHIFLQMPGDHIDLIAISGLLWCVLLPVQRHSPGELVILWYMQYALVQDQRFFQTSHQLVDGFLFQTWSELCGIMDTCLICHQ